MMRWAQSVTENGACVIVEEDDDAFFKRTYFPDGSVICETHLKVKLVEGSFLGEAIRESILRAFGPESADWPGMKF